MPTGELCSLCGKPPEPNDPLTREHVPPKQFFPKAIREGINLWADVPTHKSCNNAGKSDEEYFYHAMFPLVATTNPSMSQTIWKDLRRRSKNSQSRVLIRSILKDAFSETPQGLTLPPGIVRLECNEYRLQQVPIKIARCLFYREHRRVMPRDNCRDIRLCHTECDVPEIYSLGWALSNPLKIVPASPTSSLLLRELGSGVPDAAYSPVFSYRRACFDGLHYYSLMFWEAFVYCLAFEDPDPNKASEFQASLLEELPTT